MVKELKVWFYGISLLLICVLIPVGTVELISMKIEQDTRIRVEEIRLQMVREALPWAGEVDDE